MSERDPDAELLARVAGADASAVRQLVACKLPRLLALAVRMLGDRMEAEDVAQEAFVRIWKQAPHWREGEARVDTWLHRVAMNLCYDRLRVRREVPDDTLDEAQPEDAGQGSSAPEARPFAQQAREGRRAVLRLVAAPQLDRPALDAALADTRDADRAVREHVEAAVAGFVATLTPAERATFAQSLKAHGQWRLPPPPAGSKRAPPSEVSEAYAH